LIYQRTLKSDKIPRPPESALLDALLDLSFSIQYSHNVQVFLSPCVVCCIFNGFLFLSLFLFFFILVGKQSFTALGCSKKKEDKKASDHLHNFHSNGRCGPKYRSQETDDVWSKPEGKAHACV
jgi:hypothetical protein